MKYTIISSVKSIEELLMDVSLAIRQGWIPLGGVSISLSETDEQYYFLGVQAMTKEE